MDDAKNSKVVAQALVAEILEPRILYSADSLSAIGTLFFEEEHGDDFNPLDLFAPLANEISTDTTLSDLTEIVFIDARVQDLQTLIDDIQQNKGSSTSVVVIDSTASGIDIVTNTLQNMKSVDAVHFVSHSLGTGIRLGMDILDTDSLASQSVMIGSWSHALAESADLLIYGCDIGSTEAGLILMTGLAELTGADVAISNNETGAKNLGGDWTLEVATGHIKAANLLSTAAQAHWDHLLSSWNASARILSIDYTGDKFNTVDQNRYDSVDALIASAQGGDNLISLREAIAAANNDSAAGQITIQLTTDYAPYNLSIAGSNEDANTTGDLDVTRDLAIVGNGSASTNIAAISNFADGTDMRLIEVHNNATFDMVGINISGGRSYDAGGAIRINSGTSTLTDVIIANNHVQGANGGGIHVDNATLSIRDSRITDNHTDGNGGGITVAQTAEIRTNNTEVIDNSAGVDGGGIFVLGKAIVRGSSEVINNTAGVSGGGAYVEGKITVDNAGFSLNESGLGGGLFIANSTGEAQVRNAQFTDNDAMLLGGGIYTEGKLNVENSTFHLNTADDGGGIYYSEADANAKNINNTFFDNTARDSGGAIAILANNTLNIEHATIASNKSAVWASAVFTPIDFFAGGAQANVYIENSLLANNTVDSGNSVLGSAVVSLGYNVIDDTPSSRTYSTHFTDIIDRTAAPYTVNVDLASTLESEYGSFAHHLKIGPDSDALNAASGAHRLDAFGIASNGFTDAGALELEETTPANKIYFIDKSDDSVWRMNENGRAIQKIIEPITYDGLAIELLDVAFDNKSRHVFALGYNNAGVGTSILYTTDADGRNGPVTLVFSDTAMALEERHIISALAIAETPAGSSNNLFITGVKSSDGSRYIVEASLDYTTDANFQTVIDETNWGAFNGFSFNTPAAPGYIASIDVNYNPLNSTEQAITWADAGTTGNDHFSHYVYSDTGADTFWTDDLATYGASDVEASIFVPGIGAFLVYNQALFLDDVSVEDQYPEVYYIRTGTEGFNDVEYDPIMQQVWFADANGVIGATNVGLVLQFNRDLPAGMQPTSITLATYTRSNTPPVATTSLLTVDEGEIDKIITTAHISTVDQSETGPTAATDITYTLQDNGPSNGNITLNGTLLLPGQTFTQDDIDNNLLKYTHDGSETITDSIALQVSDGSGVTQSERLSLKISVLPVNDAPVINLLSTDPQVNENAAAKVIATFTITDAENDPITVSIDTDPISNIPSPYATLTNDGAGVYSVIVNAGFDYETFPATELNLSVTAKDSNNASAEPENFLIPIADINEGPTSTAVLSPDNLVENGTYTYSFQIPAGTFVDPEGDNINYTIVETGTSSLPSWITQSNDTITIQANELTDARSGSDLLLTINTSDEHGVTGDSVDMAIQFPDINQNPQAVVLTHYSNGSSGPFSVPENTLNFELGELTTIDPDSIDTGNHTYSINTPEDTRFAINASNKLKLAPGVTLNHESEPNISIAITSTDPGGESVTTLFSITVTNTNEAPLAIVPASVTVEENTTGQIIPPITLVDSDVGSILTLELFNSDGTNNSNFTVNNDNSITLLNPLDAEKQAIIPLSVVVSDGNLDTDYSLYVLVGDTNEAPVIVDTLPVQTASEAQPFSYTIPPTLFSDAENDSIALNIAMATNEPIPAWLEFDATTGTLRGTPDDTDSGQTLDFLVTAITEQSASVTAAPLRIVVDDTNQTPNLVSLNKQQVSELSAGAVVGTLSTIDPDASDTQHTYSVDDQRFEVLNNKLKLKDTQELDVDEDPELTLNITTTDTSGASTTLPFTIMVQDVNESPVFQSPIIQNTSLSSFDSLDLSSLVITDPEQDEVTVDVSLASGAPLPSWVTFNSVSKVLSFDSTPQNTERLDLLLIAADGKGGVATQTISVAITQTPEPAAALQIPIEIPTQAATSVVTETALVTAPAPETQLTEEISNKETAGEEIIEPNSDIVDSNETHEFDLASLIHPIENVSVIAIDKPGSALPTIKREIVTDQEEANESGLLDIDLQSVFTNSNDLGFNAIALEFDKYNEELVDSVAANKTVIGSTFTISSGFSFGYLLWLLRGGALMGSVLSSLPAWRLVDPLPVLGSLGDDLDDDDESLESLVKEQSETETER